MTDSRHAPATAGLPSPSLSTGQRALVQRILDFCRRRRHGPPSVFLIEGEAGTGKSVVLNAAFAGLQQLARQRGGEDALQGSRNRLLVNHPEMIKFYRRLAETVPTLRKGDYQRPTSFVNACHKSGTRADIVLVDEAHLLLSRADRYNRFAQDNHLQEILGLAQIVILVFDPNQVLKFKSYWDPGRLQTLLRHRRVETVRLQTQFRMHARPDVIAWIRAFHAGELHPLPARQPFDFRVFDDAQAMYETICADDRRIGMSRMLATYDYPYTLDGQDHFIREGRFHLRWDRSLPQEPLAWAERPDTIEEVGSVYTVQGFDLNCAGVILGPSVRWDAAAQRVVIDTARYQDRAAFAGLQGIDSPEAARQAIMRNAIQVLMTRPTRGLYLYASDPSLRAQLARLRHARES